MSLFTFIFIAAGGTGFNYKTLRNVTVMGEIAIIALEAGMTSFACFTEYKQCHRDIFLLGQGHFLLPMVATAYCCYR